MDILFQDNPVQKWGQVRAYITWENGLISPIANANNEVPG